MCTSSSTSLSDVACLVWAHFLPDFPCNFFLEVCTSSSLVAELLSDSPLPDDGSARFFPLPLFVFGSRDQLEPLFRICCRAAPFSVTVHSRVDLRVIVDE